MMPTLTRVSIVVDPPRAALNAAEWNGHAPHVTTGRARSPTTHCQPGKCQLITIETAMIGTARMREPMNRGRRCRGS